MATTKKVDIFDVDTKTSKQKITVELPPYEKEYFEDVGFMTSMILVMLGNYAQTGHYGGPLSYTPANVCVHLGGKENGGLRYDIRYPKKPFTDKFMLAGGHCIPTCYALWMVLYEAMYQSYEETKDEKYKVDPKTAIWSIDCLGFRRSSGAVKDLLKENGLEENELFKQSKIRGIRALMGHAESTDATNDVNGGPSGIGVANTAGKAAFWDMVQCSDDIKVIVFEGEFAFTEGHAQELKTLALSQQVGKRMRLFLSWNNAGIDDTLIGGVIKPKYDRYDISNQFASYGWRVVFLEDGEDYDQLLSAFRNIEESDPNDRRPVVIVGTTIKGWWPSKLGVEQIVSYQSHPYNQKTNSPYFIALCESFEKKYGVKFEGIRDGAPKTEKDRLIQFKKNIDICLSVMNEKKGLRNWITERLLTIAESVKEDLKVSINTTKNPYLDDRLKVENLPMDPVEVTCTFPKTEPKKTKVSLFLKPGVKKGTRRAISEIGKWCNHVTGNRWVTVAADLSNSINVEAASLTGHYDPVENPSGTRLKAGIQECVNAATMCGIASQTVSSDPKLHVGIHGVSGTYGAFTPLMYLPLRIFCQQNQDSPFELGVVNIIAGHSGPETAADARSHFGVFSPQVWTLFPKGQVINLYFWDYNDVAPGYFAALQTCLKRKETKIIVVHVARPDMVVADRSKFADSDVKAAAKGMYVIREYDDKNKKGGVVFVQGSSSTVNLVSVIPRLEKEGLNVRIISVVSEDLFNLQSNEYREKVLPLSHKYDAMVITTMTKRIQPVSGLGPLTEEYSMSADFDDRWRTGGLEDDVIKEAKLDPDSIFEGIKRFVNDRESRLERTKKAIGLL